MQPGQFIHDSTPTSEVDRIEKRTRALADEVRALVDATIRSTVDGADLDQAQALIQQATALLTAQQLPGPAGVRYNDEKRFWHWGNAVVGQRNALALPLEPERGDDGVVRASGVLGAAYEGPPGLAHGGVASLLLDHVMGMTASAGKRQAFTGTLTLKYLRGTPLGDFWIESRIEREEGRKIFVRATLSDAAGVTVEADGIFIEARFSPPVG